MMIHFDIDISPIHGVHPVELYHGPIIFVSKVEVLFHGIIGVILLGPRRSRPSLYSENVSPLAKVPKGRPRSEILFHAQYG